MKRNFRTAVAVVLMAALGVSGTGIKNTGAAKTPKLNKKSIEIKVGKTAVIKVNNGKKAAKVTWKTSKKSVVSIVKSASAGNKASATVKGNGRGRAKVTASYKLKGRVKKLDCNVKVSDNETPVPTQTPAETASQAPTQTPAGTASPAPTQTSEPTNNPTMSPEPTARVVTAEEAYVEEKIPKDFKSMKDEGVEYGSMDVNVKYYSGLTDSDRTVNIALPPGYESDKDVKKYPVVYMMHGIACNKDMFGTSIQDSSIAKIYANMRAQGECEDMIIVFPNIRVSDTPETGDNTHTLENYKFYDDFREDLIDYLMPFMEENYSVATGRENTAVCGWSMGGREALYIGLSRPDLFGYVAGYCPAFGLLPYKNPDVERGEEGLLVTPEGGDDTITLPEEYRTNTYVQISAGTADTVVKDEPKKYDNALKKGEVPHIYNEYSSGHGDGVYDPGFYVFISNAFKLVQ